MASIEEEMMQSRQAASQIVDGASGWSNGFTPSYKDLPQKNKTAVKSVADKHGVKGDIISWYESDEGRRVLAAYYSGIPNNGRVRRNDSPTRDESEELTYGMHRAIIRGTGGNIPTAPYKESGYDVPYLIEKEIRADGNRMPSNALDSLAKYAGQAGISLQEALGLYRQETAAGSVPFGNTGGDNDRALMNSNYHREYGSIPANYLVRDFEYDRVGHEVDRKVPPLLHAFQYFKAGKYNPKDRSHTDDVLKKGADMLNSPAVKEWLRTSPFAKGVPVWKKDRKK